MDFTEIYRHSNALVAFSPGGNWILAAVHDRLIVRRADSFQITRTWRLDSTPSPTHIALTSSSRQRPAPVDDGAISHAAWACDSEYLLAACARRGVVSVFKMRDEEWRGRIAAGAEGLVKAEWAPDGRSVLCFSEWGLRVTIWSLVTGTATYIQYPIHPDRGYAFRADGRYFILAERHKSKDTVGVYDTAESFKLARHFPLPTSQLSSIALSPSGNHLAVWEGPLEYKLHILSLSGDHLATFAPRPDPGFGIRTVAWHPTGAFIAVGGWDDKIHILDSLTWTPCAMFELQTRIPSSVSVWREPVNWLEATQGRGFLSYERLRGTQVLPTQRADATKPNPKSGTSQLEWNKDGSVLLARFDTSPTAVHLYSFPVPKTSLRDELFAPRLHTVLLHARGVAGARWNPLRRGALAVWCGAGAVHTWSDEWVEDGAEGADGAGEEMAECIGVPAKEFATREVRWAPDGKGLVLLDKDTFCCAFEVEGEGAEAQEAQEGLEVQDETETW